MRDITDEQKSFPYTEFIGQIPFYLSADTSLVEKFMLTSDWPVDPKAKYAAFYLFHKPKRFNWKTKQLSDTKDVVETSNTN